MVSNLGLTYFYANNFLVVDEDKFEVQELYTEGLMNSFGAFLVLFLLQYCHFKIFFSSWFGYWDTRFFQCKESGMKNQNILN